MLDLARNELFNISVNKCKEGSDNDMADRAPVCFRCANFTRYYTKGTYRYNISKKGYCKKFKSLVSAMNSCDDWRSNHCKNYKRLSSRKQWCVKVLYELLLNISAIRQILQEEEDEGVLIYDK